jgi:hypothetical protein
LAAFRNGPSFFDDRFLLLLETSGLGGAFGTQQEAELRCVVRAFLLSVAFVRLSSSGASESA